MQKSIAGRQSEKQHLQRLFDSTEPEFLAIYGRRRVGKTFLVKEFFEDKGFLFELTGERDASLADQLQNFAFAYRQAFPHCKPVRPRSWREALQSLAHTLDAERPSGKLVLFFDELPWLASRKSGFLQALDHFWNSWANRRREVLLVVCGSAASWMIGKLLHDRGGLYNRVTAQMQLLPFTLTEVDAYLRSRSAVFSRKDILELYMCLGGVPYYLRQIEPNTSVAQNMDRLCFARGGPLRNEFPRLFQSLFENAESHVEVIRALAKKRSGLTRKELLASTSLTSGGHATRILDELEQSGFVSVTPTFGKSRRRTIVRLVDEFSLFHLTWMEPMRAAEEGHWLAVHNGRSWKSWAGFCFESVCLKHILPLKRELGISGVQTTQSGWIGEVDGKRAQIDIVLDRADNCINLLELKFSDHAFTITKQYAAALQNKLRVFRRATGTRKNLFLTMLTTHGCRHNEPFSELRPIDLTMDALFEN